MSTLREIFDGYEAVRHRMPARGPGGACERVPDLGAVADRFDVFLLDAFGVLNVGEAAIPGAAERVRDLRERGKRVLVVSNAAGLPHARLMEKYDRLGMGFAPEDVVTSRAALLTALDTEAGRRWGIMAAPSWGRKDLEGLDLVFLEDDPAPYAEVDGFLLVGSSVWSEARQTMLEAAIAARSRPVLVGNPDIAAPQDDGASKEPGYWAHRLADRTGVEPRFFGKPFGNIYDLAFARLDAGSSARVLMVGDSLHTDVLGAQTAGISSALVTGHGLLKGLDIAELIETSGLRPDLILPSI
ncbi:HAD-IIA family hydrolase [Jannaschia aquimarina]|uniref:YutF protein n=1 Tax=Jannaschia aquimarina TaxID=935700 RepID=A0A0D1EH58_9RHOB|nr:HAD-IIA family hydrolase [Jannaschia aquimarina]KIT15180.1 putative hydrolase YutF [Jannaschia aquimarina]SNS85782.1 HAD-superfamily class IIA hydrolase, TIGR01459 [Jannaschia aquimarina]